MIRTFILIVVFTTIAIPGTMAFADDATKSFDRSVSDALKDVGDELNKAGRKTRDTINKAASDVNKALKSEGKKSEGKKNNKNRKEPAKTD